MERGREGRIPHTQTHTYTQPPHVRRTPGTGTLGPRCHKHLPHKLVACSFMGYFQAIMGSFGVLWPAVLGYLNRFGDRLGIQVHV